MYDRSHDVCPSPRKRRSPFNECVTASIADEHGALVPRDCGKIMVPAQAGQAAACDKYRQEWNYR